MSGPRLSLDQIEAINRRAQRFFSRVDAPRVKHQAFRPPEIDQEGNAREAFVLLDLIDAEFRTDPLSTQCFDARIVERVKACVAKHKGTQGSS